MGRFDFEQIRREQTSGYREQTRARLLWLSDTFEFSDEFWRELFDFSNARASVGFKSRLGEYYDLYRDLVGRHPEAGHAAFAEYDSLSGWKGLTYGSIQERTGLLRDAWGAAGVGPGANIALVMEPDADFMLAVLTALRLGLVVTVLPPLGATFVLNRLQALSPNYVACRDDYLPWLGEFGGVRLSMTPAVDTVPSGSAASHVYPAQSPVLRAFSPFSRDPLVPVEVTAHELFTRILRDAELVFAFTGGESVAAPGFSDWQFQPQLALTCTFAGGCFSRISPRDLQADPSVLDVRKVSHLGISPTVRDQVLSGKGPRYTALKAWFRDPSEPLDWENWDRFTQLLAIDKVPGFNVLGSAAHGGSFLYSAWSERLNHISVIPGPGDPFELQDVNGSGQAALGSNGIYTPTVSADPVGAVGQFLINHNRPDYMFSGGIGGSRRGYVYPSAEVVEVAERHEEVDAAAAVINPATGRLNDSHTLLVGFVDPRRAKTWKAQRGGWIRQIQKLIGLEMGREFIPDRIELFPLQPRYTDGELDQDWCRSQYVGGTLGAKTNSPLFVDLAALQRIVASVADRS